LVQKLIDSCHLLPFQLIEKHGPRILSLFQIFALDGVAFFIKELYYYLRCHPS